MKLKKLSFISFFSIIYILVGINFFGLFNFKTDQLWGGVNTFDIFLLLSNGLFFLILLKTELLSIILKKPFLKYFFYLYLFIIFIIITMPSRGPISILDASRVARDYLIIPLAFLIYYDIYRNRNYNFYKKLFLFIAIFTSIQIIINAFSPETIKALFPEVRAREGLKLGFQRNIFQTASMIFPHIACLYLLIIINDGKKNNITLSLFFILFIASALQGFRIYFLIMLLSLICIHRINLTFQQMIKRIAYVTIVAIAIFVFDAYYFNNQIYGKFDTTVSELSGAQAGTLRVRYLRDQIFMYPRFYEKPLQGWGFIYYGSRYGNQIGMKSSSRDRNYSLYSIDSGYLTLLIQFGLIGVIIILFFIFKIIISLKHYNTNFNRSTIHLWMLLILSLATHGAFFSIYGLLPLSIFMGLTAFVDEKSKRRRKQCENIA